MRDFGKKIRPTLGLIISETKCNRDKPFFQSNEGVNTKGPNSIAKCH